MRLLLDTHAFIWWLGGDSRLPDRIRALLADETNEIFVSAASAWELSTKHRLGKLPGIGPIVHDIEGAITSQGFAALEISIRHAQHAGLLGADHRDPFDRMLAAQAHAEGLVLVSLDEALDAFGVQRLW